VSHRCEAVLLQLQVVGELPALVFQLVQVQLLCLKLDPTWWMLVEGRWMWMLA
jgi:hypothetical protein